MSTTIYKCWNIDPRKTNWVITSIPMTTTTTITTANNLRHSSTVLSFPISKISMYPLRSIDRVL